jgi:glycosyltransferase involved in cell wall biosynthesis
MRIFNIVQCANLGGMEKTNLALLSGLRALGHDVEMLSLNPIEGLKPLLEEHAIPASGLTYRGRGGWRGLPQLKSRLAAVRSDALIMTGHNLMAMMALGRLCRGRRLLMIHFHHGGVKPAWQWRLIYHVAAARFAAIGFVSDFIRREAEAIYPPLAKISHTIGLSIDLGDLPSAAERAKARRELALPAEARIVGNCGWLIARKRFDIFLRVAQEIAAREPRALFVIAGDGPEAAGLKSLAYELGIAERVRWLGWQSSLTTFYRSLDLMVFNTDWDALGRAPLEALGSGVPVVASAINSGLGEVLDPESYGFLFPEHDVERLAKAALDLLGDQAKAQRLVFEARRHIGEVATVERQVARVCRLLGVVEGATADGAIGR